MAGIAGKKIPKNLTSETKLRPVNDFIIESNKIR